MLQGPPHARDPTAPAPPAAQLGGAPLGLHTPPGDTVLARLIDDDPGHLARGRTGGAQPHVTPPRLPRVLLPAPPLALAQVVACALAPIGQSPTRGRFALEPQGPLLGSAHLLPARRVATLPGGHPQRRWPCHAEPPPRCPACIAQHPHPRPLVSARRPRQGAGRRRAQAPGTTKRPSPTTTSSKSPSRPDNTRVCWPLHHLPTTRHGAPYLENTASSQSQGHCQRLWVAGLVACT